jgi:hypothetical protein
MHFPQLLIILVYPVGMRWLQVTNVKLPILYLHQCKWLLETFARLTPVNYIANNVQAHYIRITNLYIIQFNHPVKFDKQHLLQYHTYCSLSRIRDSRWMHSTVNSVDSYHIQTCPVWSVTYLFSPTQSTTGFPTGHSAVFVIAATELDVVADSEKKNCRMSAAN